MDSEPGTTERRGQVSVPVLESKTLIPNYLGMECALKC